MHRLRIDHYRRSMNINFDIFSLMGNKVTAALKHLIPEAGVLAAVGQTLIKYHKVLLQYVACLPFAILPNTGCMCEPKHQSLCLMLVR